MTPPRKGFVSLLIGPAGSGKTTAALAEYRAALENVRVAWPRRSADVAMESGSRHAHADEGMPSTAYSYADEGMPRTLWIAPTHMVAAEMRDALVDPRRAILDPGVTTLADLAEETVRQARLRLRRISPLQRRWLLGRLIAQAAAAGRLQHFAPVAGTPGLVAHMDEQIADRQRRGVAPVGVPRPDADPREHDVADLHARYTRVLAAADLVDAAALLQTAAQSLASSRSPSHKFDLLIVDGFTTFTAGELALLAQLAERSARTLITLPGEAMGWHALRSAAGRGESATDATTSVADSERATLRPDLFARPGAAAEAWTKVGAKRTACGLAPAWPALAHLQRNLFRNYHELEPVPPDAAATLDRIQVVAANGVQTEIDEVARRVKRLLVDGAAPADIVVSFRSTRDVADRVRQAFDDFGIPTLIDAPRRLAAAPLVRSLTNVLRLAAEDWPYRRLLRVAADRSLRVFEAVDGGRTAIETCVRHAQLPDGRGALFAQLERWAADDAAGVEPTAATAACALAALRELAAMLEVLPRRATLDGWIAALGPLAEKLGLIRPAAGDAAGNWAILVGGLQAAGRIDAWTGWGAEEFTLAEFAELVTTTAAQSPATARHDATGRVRVLSAERARFTRPRHLLLAGLSEQAFPAVHRAAGADDLGGSAVADAHSGEMLLFYQLVTRPTESLTLSYPALDERAQSLPPSPFLMELERAFGDAALPRTVQPLDGGRRDADDSAAPLSRSSLRRTAVSRALDRQRELLAVLASESGWHALRSAAGRGAAGVSATTPVEDSERATPSVGQAILAGIEAVADRSRRDHFGAFEGLVASEAVAARLRDRFGRDHLWSPSQLETYAACPFVFFGEQLLQLRPSPELALESDVRRRGSVLHETLARLYAELRGQQLDPEQVAAVLAERFHAALADVAQARPGRGLDAALREIERRQIAAWAEGFARQDAEYRAQWTAMDHPPEPAHFEVRFGPARRQSESEPADALSTDAPFALPAKIDGVDERVQFSGQIDRIDVGRLGDRTVFNVIDYKTSKSAAVKEEEIAAGRQLQLPLYALAVEQHLLDKQGAVPLSAGYWSVKGKGFARGGRSSNALEINQVRQGALAPAPGWKQVRAALETRIGEIIASIRRGQFPVFNENPNCTSTCDLRTICRIAHIRSLEKVWPPPNEAKNKK